MRIIRFSFCLCIMYFLNCEPADLCNSADATSKCGILQLVMPKPGSSRSSSNGSRTPLCSPCRMFVTALPYNANLGGISGADNKCSTDTNKPTTGFYKALVVDDVNRRACTSANCTSGGITEQLDWVIAPNTSYVQAANTSAVIFISDANGIFTNTLTSLISVAAAGIWTGIKNNPNWDWQTDTTHTCSSWADSTTNSCGTYGVTSWTDSRAIAIYTVYGNGSATNNLLCVEQ